jgi:photosystem II stability/assembly factor-like uncharacterized protein
MKKLIIFSIMCLFALSALLFLFLNIDRKDNGNSLDIKNYYQWMQMRYKDPKTNQIPNNIRSLELQFAASLPGSNFKNGYSNMLENVWTRRGPINIGGRTRALAFDTRNENILLAGGVSSGMWRSSDNGNSWRRTTSLNQLSSVSCISQDKRQGHENTWYYGTGEFFGNSAALLGNGVFKSNDNGNSWQPLSSTITGSPVSWDNQFDYIWNITTDNSKLNQDIVYASVGLGAIVRSSDGGNTWQATLGGFGNNRSFCTDISITSTGILYASLSEYAPNNSSSITKGIYRSVDGINWKNITPQFMPKKYNRIVIGIAPSDENVVYFVGETPNSGLMTLTNNGDTCWHSFWKYTYKSGDGTNDGGSWEDRSDNLPIMESNRRGSTNSQRGYDLVVSVKPDNPEVVFIGTTNVYRSTDAFASKYNYDWVGGYYYSEIYQRDYSEYPNHHPDIHALVFSDNNPNVLYTGTDGGVHKTLNCLKDSIDYISLNKAYYTTQFYSIALGKEEGSQKLMGGLQDNTTLITTTENLLDDWQTVTKGDGFFCEFVKGTNITITSRNSFYQPKITLWRTKYDNNGAREFQTRIDPAGSADFIWNTPFMLDPNDNNRIYLAGGKVIWRNNDLTEIPMQDSRDSVKTGWDSLTYSYNESSFITALHVSTTPKNRVYYGTSDGRLFKIENANLGNPKPDEITGSEFPLGYISSITSDPVNADLMLISFSNYGVISIFQTTNNGLTWAPVSGNLEEYQNGTGNGPAVNWLSILKVNNKNKYYAGTSTGLYSTSFLNGKYTVWTQESDNLIGNSVIHMMDVRQSDRTIAVGSHGLGAFSAQINETYPVPAKPELIYPQNDTGGVKNSVLFSWKSIPEAVFYKLELSLYSDFNIVSKVIDGIKDNKTYLSIPADTQFTYYWRVTALNSGGFSEPSEVREFLTAAPPPILLYPEFASNDMPLNLDLSWSFQPCCSSYHVQVSSSISFGSGIVADTFVSTSPLSLKNLVYDKRYYWRVASVDSWGEGPFSKSSNFRTKVSTGVETVLNDNFSIYPNPARNQIKINLIDGCDTYTEIWLHNIIGTLRRKLFNASSIESGILVFNIEDLFPGLYTVIISNQNYTLTKPIIVY